MQTSNLIKMFRVAEIELVYKYPVRFENRVQMLSSDDAYNVFKQHWDENKIELVEQFKIILLDHRNSCLGVVEIATGGMVQCPIDPKVIFATALKAKATHLIGAHNHPSGNEGPSDADIRVTRRLVEAGNMLDLKFTDNLILTSRGYYSMAEHGLIP